MNPVKNTIEAVRLLVSGPDHYIVSLARTQDQVRQAQALRFQVFNIELEEGLFGNWAPNDVPIVRTQNDCKHG